MKIIQVDWVLYVPTYLNPRLNMIQLIDFFYKQMSG